MNINQIELVMIIVMSFNHNSLISNYFLFQHLEIIFSWHNHIDKKSGISTTIRSVFDSIDVIEAANSFTILLINTFYFEKSTEVCLNICTAHFQFLYE